MKIYGPFLRATDWLQECDLCLCLQDNLSAQEFTSALSSWVDSVPSKLMS